MLLVEYTTDANNNVHGTLRSSSTRRPPPTYIPAPRASFDRPQTIFRPQTLFGAAQPLVDGGSGNVTTLRGNPAMMPTVGGGLEPMGLREMPPAAAAPQVVEHPSMTPRPSIQSAKRR